MKNDGGQAFPFVHEAAARIPIVHPGMSLRDYFAASVHFSMADVLLFSGKKELSVEEWAVLIAQLRGIVADAMIAERAKG